MVVQSAVLAFSSLLVLNRRGCRCFGRFCSGRFTVLLLVRRRQTSRHWHGHMGSMFIATPNS